MIEQTIAHYRITSKLGQGGMGEVYRATDTKLDRDVAIKILPEAFAGHPERLARFEREAKALAALKHPNIAVIHGIEQMDNTQALVLELVEGQTLGERLESGPVPMDEALKIFQEIAEALEAAHDKDIVHRDLKPDNIKIDDQGRVKVLDFGLAKVRAAAESTDAPPSAAATITAQFTVPGKIMGTPAYMSPEQARGGPVDQRTDIWAFGCCLYEALTGRLPFEGQTPSDIMAAVLKTDPDLDRLPAESPRELRTLLRRCLDKDPRRRIRHCGDIALTLEDAALATRLHTHGAVPIDTGSGAPWWGRLLVVMACIALLACGYSVIKRLVVSPGTGGRAIRSLAVLPFKNMTTDPELVGLDRFIQNAVLTELREVADIETANMPAKIDSLLAAEKTELEMAKELAVDGLVIGDVTRQGDDISVLVSVINGTTGREEVGQTIKRPLDQLSLIPSIAALAIVDALKIDLQATDRQRIATPGTQNHAAFLAYQKGLELYDLRQLAQAQAHFEAAAKLDPDFAEAEAYAFNAAWFATLWGGTPEFPGDFFERESKNLARLPQDGSEHAALRFNQTWSAIIYERDWKKVRDIYWSTRGKGLLTGDDLLIMAVYYETIEGRLQESLNVLKEAQALEPERLTYKIDEVWRNYSRGNHAEALRLMKAFPPDKIEGESFFTVLLSAGQLDQAQRMVEQHMGGLKDVEARLELARIHALRGDHDEGRTLVASLERRAQEGIHVPYAWIARSYAYLGDMDAAFRWLQDGLDNGRGDFSMVTLRMEDMLRVFAEEPRYWEVVDAMQYPPLPIDHPYYDVEQRMRFGKGIETAPITASPVRTLTVLPFENAKQEDAESQWLSKTLPEALKSQLKPLQRLEIKPAGFTDVDATVQGTFVREGDQLHVTVSLLNHAQQTEQVLGNYTKPALDIFQLQNDIAIAVAEEIRSNLSEEERALIAKENDIDPQAYIAYRRGFDLYWTHAKIEQAVAEFTRAITLDPDYIDPMVLLADAQWWPNTIRKTSVKPLEGFARAKERLAKAIELAPEHSRVLWQQGYIALAGDWDWKSAQRFLLKSILNAPDEADFYEGYAFYKYRVEGNFDDARDLLSRGLKLDPENAPLRNLEAFYFFHDGNYEKALSLLDPNRARNSEHLEKVLVLTKCLINLGRLDEAREEIERAIVFTDGHPDTHLLLAEILARSDDAAGARSILKRIEEERKQIYVSPLPIARVYAVWGDWDSTFRLLEEGYTNRDWKLTSLRTHRLLILMGDQPRYWDLVDRMNFPALPIQHPFHQKEQEMRFGKVLTDRLVKGPPSDQ